jgi:hypothetical protein
MKYSMQLLKIFKIAGGAPMFRPFGFKDGIVFKTLPYLIIGDVHFATY